MNLLILKKAKNQHLLLFLIFSCSLVIRFINLGNIPLNDSEGRLALSALNMVKGDVFNPAPQTSYLAFTSLLFQFLSASNVTARFFPAVIGSILPLLPFLFKKWIGTAFAILLSMLLIFDPVLISLSRQADSRQMSLFFFLLAFAFLLHRKLIFAGIAAALFILSGCYAWYLSVVMLISLFLYIKITKPKSNTWGVFRQIMNDEKNRKPFITSTILCGLLIGTGFLFQPQLINSAFQSLPEFFEGWFKSRFFFTKAYEIVVGFMASYLLFIIFSFIGIIDKHGRFTPLEKFSLIYGVVSFIFLIGYPVASQCDVLFFLPFLYFFVCRGIVRWRLLIKTNLKANWLIGILIIGLIGFIWLAVLRILNLPFGSIEYAQLLVAIIGCGFFISLIFLLIAWGWSWKIALSGFSFGLFTILAIFQASMNLLSFSPSRRPESNLWWTSTYVNNANILMKTVEEVSLWNTGIRNGLEIQIAGINSPGLLWQFREHKIFLSDVILSEDLPLVIISKTEENPLLEDSYRGQKAPFYSEPLWIQNLPQSLASADFYRWLFFRDSIIRQDGLFIWMNSNLFIGNNIKFESRVT